MTPSHADELEYEEHLRTLFDNGEEPVSIEEFLASREAPKGEPAPSF